jgi:hypothetical protein
MSIDLKLQKAAQDAQRSVNAIQIPSPDEDRSFKMRPLVALALAAVVGIGVWALVRSAADSGPVATSPTTVSPPLPNGTVPSSTPTSVLTGSGWGNVFHSDFYHLYIGVPSGWTVMYADHDWDMEEAPDPASTGQEMFLSPAGDVRVSVWKTQYDPDATPIKSYADMAAWVAQYCQQAGYPSCDEAIARATPLCLEFWDCHPTGLLVPFEDDVQAFVTGTDIITNPGWPPAEGMTVVVVWRPDSHPSVAEYGGAKRLLAAFLSTMDVWRPDRTQRCQRVEQTVGLSRERWCEVVPSEDVTTTPP